MILGLLQLVGFLGTAWIVGRSIEGCYRRNEDADHHAPAGAQEIPLADCTSTPPRVVAGPILTRP